MPDQLPSRANGLFGIYVHWPFCAAKCPYCDFNSHVHRGAFDENAFVESYKKELTYFAALKPEETVYSIFFGGGTPSLMSPEAVQAILDTIGALWPVQQGAEITLEANPQALKPSGLRPIGQPGSIGCPWACNPCAQNHWPRLVVCTRLKRLKMPWRWRNPFSHAPALT